GMVASLGAVDTELYPLVIGIPAGDITPACEAPIERLQLNMMENGVFRLVLIQRDSRTWIATVNLCETAKRAAGCVVLSLIDAGLHRTGPINRKKHGVGITRKVPNGISAAFKRRVVSWVVAAGGVEQA